MFLVYIETLKMSIGDERLEKLANAIIFLDDGGIFRRENYCFCGKEMLFRILLMANIQRLRAQILKYLHSRHVLILGCVLVVLECMCIMAELMVDLQGIRIRFENEELEVQKFARFMKAQRPDAFREFEGTTLEEILITLKETAVLWSPSDSPGCDCKCGSAKNVVSRTKRDLVYPTHAPSMQFGGSSNSETETSNTADVADTQPQRDTIARYRRLVYSVSNLLDIFSNFIEIQNMYANYLIWQNTSQTNSNDVKTPPSRNISVKDLQTKKMPLRPRRSAVSTNTYLKPYSDVFVFSVNVDKDNFHVVAKFKNLSDTHISMSHLEDEITKTAYYEDYKRVHVLSHAIKYAGFGILTLMLAETLLKFVCTGLGFFKKKFEVFDAFIVLTSFILDVIFLDSRWYETGKDATTILVLLLPWRVVRIVNNFLMTINHKHYIEIMTIKKAKKRAEIKVKKLQELIDEIRKDIDLLINLSKTKGATDTEISACIYGKGRTTTLAAITSFASLMVISSLGKDPSTEHVLNDVYGDLMQDILEDDSDSEKANDDDTAEKIEFDLESTGDPESSWHSNRRTSSTKSHTSRWKKDKRRATLPRRQDSRNTGDGEDVYYVNDGFVSGEDRKSKSSRSSSLYNKGNVRSVSGVTPPSTNFVVGNDSCSSNI